MRILPLALLGFGLTLLPVPCTSGADPAPDPKAQLLKYESLAEQALQEGHAGKALMLLVQFAKSDPGLSDPMRAEAAKVLRQVLKLPAASVASASSAIHSAGEIWKLPEAFMALADLEPNENTRLSYYKQADEWGSIKARAMVGWSLLEMGADKDLSEVVNQGVQKLRQAIDAGDPDAMVLLGEALFTGRGMAQNPTEALRLATAAQDKGYPNAFYLAAKIQLKLAGDKHDLKLLEKTTAQLEKAVEKKLTGAPYFLFLSEYNGLKKNPERAVATLEMGVCLRDRDCLYWLGIWLTIGKPPLEENMIRGRALMEEAAKMGHERAHEWMKIHP